MYIYIIFVSCDQSLWLGGSHFCLSCNWSPWHEIRTHFCFSWPKSKRWRTIFIVSTKTKTWGSSFSFVLSNLVVIFVIEVKLII